MVFGNNQCPCPTCEIYAMKCLGLSFLTLLYTKLLLHAHFQRHLNLTMTIAAANAICLTILISHIKRKPLTSLNITLKTLKGIFYVKWFNLRNASFKCSRKNIEQLSKIQGPRVLCFDIQQPLQFVHAFSASYNYSEVKVFSRHS